MRRNYLILLFMLLATFLFPGGASEFGYKKYELVRQPNGQYTATASDKTVSFPSTVSDGYRVSFSDSYYEVITYGSKKYLIPDRKSVV